MGALAVIAWLVGLLSIGLLREGARSESPAVQLATRLSFAVGLWGALLISAAIAGALREHETAGLVPDRSGWWWYVLAGAIPVTLLCTAAASAAFKPVGRRLPLLLAAAATCGLYCLIPITFTPQGQLAPVGLAETVHEHRGAVAAVLLAPSLLLLGLELRDCLVRTLRTRAPLRRHS